MKRLDIILAILGMICGIVVAYIAVNAEDKTLVPVKDAVLVQDPIKSAVLIDYQKVMIYNADFQHLQESLCTQTPQCKSLREKLNAAIQTYNDNVPRRVQDAKLPPGTQFQVDTEAGTVTAIIPKSATPPTPSK